MDYAVSLCVGHAQVLVATDVAARGLDMIVDLVLNAEPPTHQSGRVDTESYVHRSGRTGRAGRKGMCITLYTPRQRGGLGEIGEGAVRLRRGWGGGGADEVVGTCSCTFVRRRTSFSEWGVVVSVGGRALWPRTVP